MMLAATAENDTLSIADSGRGMMAMMFYYAAQSKTSLEIVLEGLRAAFNLPEFYLDSHDTWDYGWSQRDGLHINVTREDGFREVEKWIPACPKGVNYQLIVTADYLPPDFVAVAEKALSAEVTLYFEREDPSI